MATRDGDRLKDGRSVGHDDRPSSRRLFLNGIREQRTDV